jgi:hypothetical protein
MFVSCLCSETYRADWYNHNATDSCPAGVWFESRQEHRLALVVACFMLVSSLAYFLTLKLEAIYS